MNKRAFSLVEVLVAAGILTIGLTAAAVLAGTIMAQQERNAVSLRAANLQEQAIRLYRMDLAPATIISLLPEPSAGSGVPAAGAYVLTFTRPSSIVLSNVGGTNVALDQTGSTLVYPAPSQTATYLTNTMTILRPSIRVKYAQ